MLTFLQFRQLIISILAASLLDWRTLTVSNQLNGVIESDVAAIVTAREDSTDQEDDYCDSL